MGARRVPRYTVRTMETLLYQRESAVRGSLLRRHMPELDFWRGVAIASVLIYHAIYWTENSQPGRIANLLTRTTVFGWLGVNLFFVLSGFLITGILLDAKGKPKYFGGFYLRRVRRILPAYGLCLLLLLIVRMISGGGLLQAVTFTSNYPLIPAARVYGPLWSLSVEEQFYLVWPLIVLLTGRRTLTGICIAICALEPLLRYYAGIHGLSDQMIHEATFLVADSLAVGALGALFFRSRYATKRGVAVLCSTLMVAAVGTLIGAIRGGFLHRANPLGAALQVVPFNLLFGACIFASVAFLPVLLGGKMGSPMRALGDISYGLYLYHLIVFTIYDRLFPASYHGHFDALLVRAAICIAAAIGLAWVSRWKYEEIFLKKKRLASVRAVSSEVACLLGK